MAESPQAAESGLPVELGNLFPNFEQIMERFLGLAPELISANIMIGAEKQRGFTLA
jgi:hypothetical protein